MLAGDGAVGISWSQRYTYCQAQTPAPSQEGSLGYYTTDCVAPLPHLYVFAAVQVTLSVHVSRRTNGIEQISNAWLDKCCIESSCKERKLLARGTALWAAQRLNVQHLFQHAKRHFHTY